MATPIAKLAVKVVTEAEGMRKGMGEVNNEVAKAEGRAKQLGRTLMRVAPSFDIKAIVANTQTAEQAIGSLGHMASSAAMSFGAIGAAAGIAVGLVVGVVSVFAKMKTEAEKTDEAAAKAFGTIIDGSKTASQALADIQTGVLVEDFNALVVEVQRMERLIAPFRGSGFDGLLGAALDTSVSSGIEAAIEHARRMHDALRDMLANPHFAELRRTTAEHRGLGSAAERARQLEDEVARLGMAEEEATRYAMAQDFAARAGVDLSEALRFLEPELERIRIAQERIAAFNNRTPIFGGLINQLNNFRQVWNAQVQPFMDEIERLRREVEQVWRPITEGERMARLAEGQGFHEAAQRIRDLQAQVNLLGEIREAVERVREEEEARLSIVRQAAAEIERESGAHTNRLEALTAGSAAAISAINQGGPSASEDEDTRIRRIAERALQIQQRQERHEAIIARAAAEGFVQAAR